MTTAATQTETVVCTRCGATTEHPEAWLLRGPDMVASGVRLGTSPTCFTGRTRPTARPQPTDQMLPGLDELTPV